MSPFVRAPLLTRRDRLAALSVLLILLGAYTATFSGLPDNPDAEVEFQTTSALVRRGSLAIGGTPEAEAIVAATTPLGQGFNVLQGRGERWYSWFGVGQAAAALPLYAAGDLLERAFPEIEARHRETTRYGAPRSEYFQHLLVGWRNPLLGALTGWLVALGARRLGARRRSAWIGGITYGLATFAWPQARSTLSDVQATFLLFAAFHLLVVARERLVRGRPARPWRAPLAGACLGAAVLTRVAAAPAALVLLAGWAAALAVRRPEGGRPLRIELAALGTPFVLALALLLGLNAWRFGDPFETGFRSALSGGFFSSAPHESLAGLWLSPGKGLLWFAPGILVAPIGLAHSWRRGERLLVLVAVAMLAGVHAPVLFMGGWHGGWTYGPRYILPLLPFAWLGTTLALDARTGGRATRVLVHAALALGLLSSLPGVLVDAETHLDLATRAARVAWPDAPGETEPQREEVRFQAIQWDLRFAAPWAHWRIFRHRVAEGDEPLPLAEIFHLPVEGALAPSHARGRGLRHFAWVDLRERLGGAGGALLAVAGVMLVVGGGMAARGLAAAAP